jgi:hypothetical protein
VIESLRQLRREIVTMRTVIGANIERVPLFPHRAKYNLLLQDLGTRLLDAHEQWLDRVEHDLADDP